MLLNNTLEVHDVGFSVAGQYRINISKLFLCCCRSDINFILKKILKKFNHVKPKSVSVENFIAIRQG